MSEPEPTYDCAHPGCGIPSYAHSGIDAMDHTFVAPPAPDVEEDEAPDFESDARFNPDHEEHESVCGWEAGDVPNPMHRLHHLRPAEDFLLDIAEKDLARDPQLLLSLIQRETTKALVEAVHQNTAAMEWADQLSAKLTAINALEAALDVGGEVLSDEHKLALTHAVFALAASAVARQVPGVARMLHELSGFTILDTDGNHVAGPEIHAAAPPFTEDDAERFAEMLKGETPGPRTVCPACGGSGSASDYDGTDHGMCLTCQGEGFLN